MKIPLNIFLKYKLIALSLLLALFSASCQDWYEDSINTNSLHIRILSPSSSRSGNSLAENTVGNIKYMLYDENGTVETMHSFDAFQNNDVTFNNLSEGQKSIVVIANTEDASCLEPVEIDHGTSKKELDSLLVRLKSPYVFTDPGYIPMIHESTISIPAHSPTIEVSLSRLFSKVTLVNDIDSGRFTIDSLIFEKLTIASDIRGESKVIAKDAHSSLKFNSDENVMPVYILPCEANQIKYSIVGKTDLGVTQIMEGIVKPKLNSNYNYTMSLSSGKITVDGVPQNIKVSIDELVGNYSSENKTITIGPDGGAFSIIAESMDSLEMTYSTNEWLEQPNNTTKADFALSAFQFRSKEYVTEDSSRETTLHIRNKYDSSKTTSITVKQTGENRGPKYYVVIVAGQSNASGRDKTAYDAVYDNLSPRIFELGMENITPPYNNKFNGQSTLSIVPLHYIGQSLDSPRMGTGKSLHLYLAKEMLKHVPNDYNVLVVSIAYSGAGFTPPATGILGVYDPVEMRPTNFPQSLPGTYIFKAREGVIYNMLTDRLKHVLNLNKRNKFVGVVWMQGEVETSATTADPAIAYNRFEDFSQAFMEDINTAIPPEQLALKQVDRNMWYNVDHTPSRRDWHDPTPNYLQFARVHYYGGYKNWNPSTFINLPENTGMNSGDEVHFGQNAFRKTIAPLVVQNMVENGIFGDTPTADKRFIRQISASDIVTQRGSINDADIQDRLMVYLPFSDTDNIAKNLSQSKDPMSIINHGMNLTDAQGLINVNKTPRSRKALKLNPNSNQYMEINTQTPKVPEGWSVSLMMRRFNARGNLKDQFVLTVPNSKSGLLFHRFQKECEGGYLTLSFQPSASSFDRFSSVTGRLSDADYVRTNEEWVHYAFTYNNATRSGKVYMNGELTMSGKLPNSVSVSNLSKLILNAPSNGTDAHITDLFVWDREVAQSTIFKTYLMSYYGQQTEIDLSPEIGDWENETLNY